MIEVPTGGGGSGGVAIQAGTQTATSGTANFANSNNVTFGMSNSSRVTASWALDIRASGSTDSRSAISFANSNNMTFGLSQGTITGSFSTSQSVQTQNLHDVTLAGNTSGALALISSGTMTLAGGNNITLSQNGNAVTISAGAGASAGIASLGNSQTTYTSGLVALSGANALTVRSSVGQVFQFDAPFQTTESAQWRIDGTGGTIPGLSTATTVNVNAMRVRPVGGISVGFDTNAVIELSVLTQSAQTQNCVDVTLAGNTSGTLALISSGTMTLAGGANVTLSQNGNAVTISAGGGTGGGGGGSESIGMSGGNTSGTAGLVSADGFQYVFAGGNNVTLSQSLDGAHKSGTLTVSGVSFANSNNLTLSVNAGTVTGSYTVPVVSNAIQAVGTATGSGTNTSRFAADDHVHVGIYSMGVHTSGNTAGNTGVRPGQFILAGSNAITLSQETAALSLQTVWFQGPASATTISGVTSANVVGTRGSRFALEDHQHVGVYSVGVSNVGNTAGNTGLLPGRMVLAGGNNIMLSVGTAAGSLQTVTISASAQSNQSMGIYASGSTVAGDSTSSTLDARSLTFYAAGQLSIGINQGNSNIEFVDGANHIIAGTRSGAVGSDINFSNSNNITFGFDAAIHNTITASYAFNVSAGTTSSGVNAVTFSNSNGVAFGFDGSNVTANIGYLSYWFNADRIDNTVTTTVGGSTSVIAPFMMPLPISISYVRLLVTNAANSTTISTTANTTITMSHVQTLYAMIYSQMTGASSRSISMVTSGTLGWTQLFRYQAAGTGSLATHSYEITYGREGNTTSFASSVGQTSTLQSLNSSMASNFAGVRYLDIPMAVSLSGGNYWFAKGVGSSLATQGTNALSNLAFTMGIYANSNPALSGIGTANIGNMGLATSSSNDFLVGLGSYTSTAIGPVGKFDISVISSNAKRISPHFQFINQA